MDAPLHMIGEGKRMDEIAVEKFIGPGVVLDARGKEIIDADLFDSVEVPEDSIVLIYTGFGSKYREASYYNNQPTVSEDFAKKAVELKVKIVGMDIFGPDKPPYLVHKILLGNETLIIENLTNLDLLLNEENFDVIALPMKLHTDAAPVRVVASVK
jgi:kynurenine formamidase